MKKKILSFILIFTIFLGLTPKNTKADSEVYLYRISGSDRFETSVEVSNVSYKKSENAILVSGRDYPDGLTGGVLASVLNGPVLLTDKNSVPTSVKNELSRLGVKNVYIVGGTGTVSKQVENSLSGYNVKRVSGSNRIETATNVAKLIRTLTDYNSNTRYFALANGYDFPDALAVGGYLANTKIPLLLTDNKTLSANNKNFISNYNIGRAILVGGTSSVSPKLLPSNVNYASYSGSDRYKTSLDIAKKGFSNVKTVVLTSGEDFPDALAASTLSKYVDGPILLTNSKSIDSEIVKYIKNGNITRLIVVGGKGKLPDSLLEIINKEQIKGPEEIGDINEPPKG
ncbi:cell wall-binding repeat-containing protein [Miniphocaeibacter halophilus]|uniref:Cell wall-binding repeat-containing protein n=1 Tax=Miniphocaeibacter halophilus TaxID=2931922 RepID=A0AC61NFC7_9FIRM|nr:cell wall-binding repeat-containing protein [Miniphocaeibacter halophilus]QQK08903.1 cell wall-binding repeat-containing protein [Miniphocaeibacter halophilus]